MNQNWPKKPNLGGAVEERSSSPVTAVYLHIQVMLQCSSSCGSVVCSCVFSVIDTAETSLLVGVNESNRVSLTPPETLYPYVMFHAS